jgi:hypothetical protein
MELTQKQIIGEYKKLKLKLGRSPKSKEFYHETSITPYHLENAFGSNPYTKLQQEVGDEPRKFGTKGRTKDEFFQVYGKVVRDLKDIPAISTWRNRKESPRPTSYARVLKINWSQMPLAFIDWANDKPEWADVVNICTSHCKENNLFSERTEVLTTSYGYVYLIKANRKGHYKIGKTGSTGGRASQLSQLDPYDRRYEHVLETTDPFGLEKYWHQRFKDKRINIDKEIFELSKEDIEAFKKFYVKEAPKTY